MHLHFVESVSHCLHKVHWHRGHEPPILTHNTSLEDWPSVVANEPYRFVEKVESCIAHTSRRDARGIAVDKHHEHSFVRITLSPFEGEPERIIFVERAIDHAGHTVIPLIDTEPEPDADAPSFQDHACMILDGAHSEFTHKPRVDRTIVFDLCRDRQLSIQELATVFQFVSRNGKIAVGEDCVAHTLWFARTCVMALKMVMHGAYHCVTPSCGEAAVKAEIGCQKALDLFFRKSFKVAYPIFEVAQEHRLRQVDLLSGEEKTQRILVIERHNKETRDRETIIRMMWEICRARDDSDLD